MRVPLEWLKEFVPVKAKPEKLAGLFTMGGLEVELIERIGVDVIFELGVTPNRADCLSIIGIAREAAALSGEKLREMDRKAIKGSGRMSDFVKISVKHPKKCPRYSARVIDGVRIGPSPSWMVKRLADCGVRSINNVVDATNYVLLEMGQPMHAFDMRFLRGGRIVVRQAGEQMPFVTLDGAEKKIESEDLLICDGEGPVALAGIMGGENSEVRDSTTRVLLESAYFEPSGIRRTSRRICLSSESSRRFERGVDPNGTVLALHRLTELIVETAGGTPAEDWIDIYPKKIRPKTVSVSATDVARIIGVDIPAHEIRRLLGAIGLAAKGSGKGASGRVTVAVPTFRPDLERKIDLIEEVARLHGYDEIGEGMPSVVMSPVERPKNFSLEDAARDALVKAGMNEAVLYGFSSGDELKPFSELSGEPIAISNPLSLDMGFMRTTLIPGLLDVCRTNMSRQRKDVRLFALQGVFHRKKPLGPNREPRFIAGLITGRRYPRAWERAAEVVDFYDMKGCLEALMDSLGVAGQTIYQRGDAHGFLHSGQFANVLCGGELIGFVGMLHPDVLSPWGIEEEVFVFELNFDDVADVARRKDKRFSEFSRFPGVERDMALVVPENIPAVEIEKSISDSGVGFIDDVRIFDVYRGKGIEPGHKSVAVKVRFSRHDRTLTEDEVTSAMDRIMGSLKMGVGATLRT
jgi:phenylalanyl-tRNA synthetase beta chain